MIYPGLTLTSVKGHSSAPRVTAREVYPKERTSITAISSRVMGSSGRKRPWWRRKASWAKAVSTAEKYQAPAGTSEKAGDWGRSASQPKRRTRAVTKAARVMGSPRPKRPPPTPWKSPSSPARRTL